ncbi:MAG: hypothetical protein HYV36_02890 [Lentisphaerae bacterium]|nr:hypothetical protein [Lentisphaerota bacterium]
MTTTRAFKSRPYDLAVNTISPADLREVIAWLRQYPRLTMGAETSRFQQAWSRWLGDPVRLAADHVRIRSGNLRP